MNAAPRDLLSNPRSDRVKQVRSLGRRSARERAGLFLVEGRQAVRELIRFAPDTIRDLYLDADAAERHPDLRAMADGWLDGASEGARRFAHDCTPQVLAEMCDTEQPQGIIAVARPVDLPLAQVLGEAPKFVVILTNVRDPGNAGTVIRGADATGADAVIVSDSSVDIYNPKVVRSTVGSLWHLPISRGASIEEIFAACRAAGLTLHAADGVGQRSLPEVDLSTPHAWVMGNEAWGLEPETRDACDDVIRVPIYGHAESLNLAMAATVCLYASAAAQNEPRRRPR